jgi:hypothetical protein
MVSDIIHIGDLAALDPAAVSAVVPHGATAQPAAIAALVEWSRAASGSGAYS